MTVCGAASRSLRKIADTLARGLVAFLMVSHAMLAFSSAVSPSHDPVRASTHAHAFADAHADQDDHGHDHEVFDDEGGMHQHGHNPADHSHDKPNVPPTHTVDTPRLSNQWLADEHRLAYPAPCARLERPPKRFPIV